MEQARVRRTGELPVVGTRNGTYTGSDKSRGGVACMCVSMDVSTVLCAAREVSIIDSSLPVFANFMNFCFLYIYTGFL